VPPDAEPPDEEEPPDDELLDDEPPDELPDELPEEELDDDGTVPDAKAVEPGDDELDTPPHAAMNSDVMATAVERTGSVFIPAIVADSCAPHCYRSANCAQRFCQTGWVFIPLCESSYRSRPFGAVTLDQTWHRSTSTTGWRSREPRGQTARGGWHGSGGIESTEG
jgi:hypothetical protein